MRYIILSALVIPAVITPSMMEMCHRKKIQPTYTTEVRRVDNAIIAQEEKCLATMVYGEARGESQKGMIAVAYTALNRARVRPVCDVVLAPKQYSIFNNNPALRAAALSQHIDPTQVNVIDIESWNNSVAVAQKVFRKNVPDPTKGATHYLAPKLMAKLNYKYPKWSKQYKMVAVVDNHQFYRR